MEGNERLLTVEFLSLHTLRHTASSRVTLLHQINQLTPCHPVCSVVRTGVDAAWVASFVVAEVAHGCFLLDHGNHFAAPDRIGIGDHFLDLLARPFGVVDHFREAVHVDIAIGANLRASTTANASVINQNL